MVSGTPNSDDMEVLGFYTQAYNEIVKPHAIWPASRYFIRHWGPLLTPSNFWVVIAARQAAYRNDRKTTFDAYNEALAHAAAISVGQVKRLKVQMGVADDPLAIFVRREGDAAHILYDVVDGKPRPKPTRYHVRLDDPLTPPDGQHLEKWLREQFRNNASVAAEVLIGKTALEYPRSELLAPPASKCDQIYAATVEGVAKKIWGRGVKSTAVKDASERLHHHLTGSLFFGTQYFREKWLPVLGHGPAYLIVYLRSLCYANPETGEMRTELSFTFNELAQTIQVSSKTIGRWFETLEAATNHIPFLRKTWGERTPTNDYRYTYRVGLVDPITSEDWPTYESLLHPPQTPDYPPLPIVTVKDNLIRTAAEGEGQFDPHGIEVKDNLIRTENEFHGGGEGQFDPHRIGSEGQIDPHVSGKSAGVTVLGGDKTDAGVKDKMIRGQGQNDPGSRTKLTAYKYYNLLLAPLTDQDKENLLKHPGWHINNADQSFVAAALGGVAGMIQHLGGEGDEQLAGLSESEAGRVAAWVLYSHSLPPRNQNWQKVSPQQIALNRIKQGVAAPNEWVELAHLSWELWRCYTALLSLGTMYHDDFNQMPGYGLWMKTYSKSKPHNLPFRVGEGLEPVINLLKSATVPDSSISTAPQDLRSHQQAWNQVLGELKLTLAKQTFENWLAHSTVLRVVGGSWRIKVNNPRATEWIGKLRPQIDPIIQYFLGDGGNADDPIQVEYVYQE